MFEKHEVMHVQQGSVKLSDFPIVMSYRMLQYVSLFGLIKLAE